LSNSYILKNIDKKIKNFKEEKKLTNIIEKVSPFDEIKTEK